MSKLSLVEKVGIGLGEYFLGAETYKFYNSQKKFLREKIGNPFHKNPPRNIELYNSLEKDLNWKNFEAIFSGKIVQNILSILGILTIFSNSYLESEPLTSPESIKAALVGSTTFLLSEASRFYFKSLIKKNKLKTEKQIRRSIEDCCM